jgi:hypothetical protein
VRLHSPERSLGLREHLSIPVARMRTPEVRTRLVKCGENSDGG